MRPTLKRLIKGCVRATLAPLVVADWARFAQANGMRRSRERGFSISPLDAYPQIKDKTVTTGFDRHYVYHTSWAARIIAETKPARHVDISSSLYFSGLVSAFVPIDFYDYRPAELGLSNLTSSRADLMALPFKDASIPSISCMHTIEHIGLGRYGDPMDPDGDIKAARELARVTAIGGNFIFVSPISEEARIEFNAHRIYSYRQIMEMFPDFELKEFAFIPEHAEKGGLIRNADPKLIIGEKYACGCFHFVKKARSAKLNS